MTTTIAAAVGALADREAPLYLSGGYYRVALTGPDGYPELLGLRRAYITIAGGDAGVSLTAVFPDGEQEDGPACVGPEETIAYWRACQEHARTIYWAVDREERTRRAAADATGGHWEPGDWSRDDPRDPVPYDDATLVLPGGTRLHRVSDGGDAPAWAWEVRPDPVRRRGRAHGLGRQG